MGWAIMLYSGIVLIGANVMERAISFILNIAEDTWLALIKLPSK